MPKKGELIAIGTLIIVLIVAIVGFGLAYFSIPEASITGAAVAGADTCGVNDELLTKEILSSETFGFSQFTQAYTTDSNTGASLVTRPALTTYTPAIDCEGLTELLAWLKTNYYEDFQMVAGSSYLAAIIQTDYTSLEVFLINPSTGLIVYSIGFNSVNQIISLAARESNNNFGIVITTDVGEIYTITIDDTFTASSYGYVIPSGMPIHVEDVAAYTNDGQTGFSAVLREGAVFEFGTTGIPEDTIFAAEITSLYMQDVSMVFDLDVDTFVVSAVGFDSDNYSTVIFLLWDGISQRITIPPDPTFHSGITRVEGYVAPDGTTGFAYAISDPSAPLDPKTRLLLFQEGTITRISYAGGEIIGISRDLLLDLINNRIIFIGDDSNNGFAQFSVFDFDTDTITQYGIGQTDHRASFDDAEFTSSGNIFAGGTWTDSYGDPSAFYMLWNIGETGTKNMLFIHEIDGYSVYSAQNHLDSTVGISGNNLLIGAIAPGEASGTALAAKLGSDLTTTTCDSCDDCQAKIDAGIYTSFVLTQNIYGLGTTHEDVCIELTDGVTFDCNGYSIIGPGEGNGVNIFNDVDVTVKNCIIQNYDENNVDPSYNNTFINNTFFNNSVVGLLLQDSHNNTLLNNKFLNNSYDGLRLENSTNNLISGGEVGGNNQNGTSARGGITLTSGSHNNNITGMYIYNNKWMGISIDGSDDIRIWNNNIDNNCGGHAGAACQYNCNRLSIQGNNITDGTGKGLQLYSGNSHTVTDNYINNNTLEGIDISSANNCNISNNTITNNGAPGIRLNYASNNLMKDNTVSNNSQGDIMLSNNAANNTLTNNTVSSYPTTFSLFLPPGSYTGPLTISGVTSPPVNPPGLSNVGKYIDMTCVSGCPSFVELYIYYSDTGLGTVPESTLEMWKYRSSWQQSGWYNTKTLNQAGNYVYANVTNYSIFAPLGMNCTCYNCTDCVNKLNSPCTTVTLGNNISHGTGTTCINDPVNFTNKTFDCQNYEIAGSSSNTGIFLSGQSGNTIKDCIIKNFSTGIGIYSSSDNNTITGCTLEDNTNHGLGVYYSNNNVVDGNLINSNDNYGIYMSSCFLQGTKILMADGTYKNIEDVKKGDVVTSYDEKNNELTSDIVLNTFVHEKTDYLIINNKLKLTPNHPIYVSGKWKDAGEIKLGDALLDKDGNKVIVKSVKQVEASIPVYNLEVDGHHNYFAEDILVHNKCPRVFTYNGAEYEFDALINVLHEDEGNSEIYRYALKHLQEPKIKVEHDPSEINYVDFIKLVVTDKGDQIRTHILNPIACEPDCLSLLLEQDEQYLVLDTENPEVYIQFEDWPELEQGYERKIEIISAGYQKVLKRQKYPQYVLDFLEEYFTIFPHHSNNNITNNNITNNGVSWGTGIYMWYEHYTYIFNNFIDSNNEDGIMVGYSDNNNIEANTITNNGQDGISMPFNALDNTFIDNILSNTRYEIFIDDYSYGEFYNQQVSSYPTNVSFIYPEDWYTGNISVDGIDTFPTLPINKQHIGRGVVLDVTSPDWIFLNISYFDSDIPAGLSESALELWKYSNGTWTLLNDTIHDMTANIIGKNLTEFSLFAPLIDLCGNGVVDPQEVCDGTNLSNETCITQEFISGNLSCSPDCLSFNTSLCVRRKPTITGGGGGGGGGGAGTMCCDPVVNYAAWHCCNSPPSYGCCVNPETPACSGYCKVTGCLAGTKYDSTTGRCIIPGAVQMPAAPFEMPIEEENWETPEVIPEEEPAEVPEPVQEKPAELPVEPEETLVLKTEQKPDITRWIAAGIAVFVALFALISLAVSRHAFIRKKKE